MRHNLPITDREVEVPQQQAIVSKTDWDGNIVYVNPAFVQISGDTAAELIGAPQNIVRHPDMPAAAFADLWRSVRAGVPWTGLVKKRCKNGDCYWVKANVTPARENGRVVGYMSVRVRPEPGEAEAAERAYRALRRDAARGARFEHGALVAPGWPGLLSRLRHASLRMRLWLGTSALNLLLGVCVASLAGGGARGGHDAAVFAATLLGLLINVHLWHTLRSGMLRPLAAALVEHAAAAAASLADEATGLSQAVSLFHFGRQPSAPAVRARSAGHRANIRAAPAGLSRHRRGGRLPRRGTAHRCGNFIRMSIAMISSHPTAPSPSAPQAPCCGDRRGHCRMPRTDAHRTPWRSHTGCEGRPLL